MGQTNHPTKSNNYNLPVGLYRDWVARQFVLLLLTPSRRKTKALRLINLLKATRDARRRENANCCKRKQKMPKEKTKSVRQTSLTKDLGHRTHCWNSIKKVWRNRTAAAAASSLLPSHPFWPAKCSSRCLNCDKLIKRQTLQGRRHQDIYFLQATWHKHKNWNWKRKWKCWNREKESDKSVAQITAAR